MGWLGAAFLAGHVAFRHGAFLHGRERLAVSRSSTKRFPILVFTATAALPRNSIRVGCDATSKSHKS